MFRFEDIKTFTAPVKVTRPSGDMQEFEATFSYLSDSQWEERGKVSSREFLAKHWVGWNGIEDADGKAFEFSAERRELLLDHQYIVLAAIGAYVEGRAGLRAKN